MKINKLFSVVLIIVLIITLLSGCGQKSQQASQDSYADTVLKNGVVYTVNKSKDWNQEPAEAVAVVDGKIAYVGDNKGAETFIGKETKVIDLQGKMVLPGFFDCHLHPMSGATYMYEVNMANMMTKEEYLDAVKKFVKEHPEAQTIQGMGFQRSVFDKVGPRKEWLDAIDSTRPIAIVSADGHSIWVNSKTMEMAGITKDTPDPVGGVIQRDPKTGEPAGLLQESAAFMVSDLLPDYSKEENKQILLWTQDYLNSVGITSAFSAGIEMDSSDSYQAYQELADEGALTVRYKGTWLLSPEMGKDIDTNIDKGIELSKQFKTPYFQVKTFKVLVDEVAEERTSYMLEPYSDSNDGWRGIKVWEDEDLLRHALQKVDKAGFQIHIHQTGDAGAKYLLDALEYVQKVNGKRDWRPEFAHCQFYAPEDIKRMGELGMSAAAAPYWGVIDDYYWDLYVPYLGAERVNKSYPNKSMLDAGVNVTIHSDWGVTEPNYMWAFYSAMTRTLPQDVFDLWFEGMDNVKRTSDPNAPLDYYVMGPLPPASDRVTLKEAIEEATINGAYANFAEKELGSLEVGKLADLVVVSTDLFKIDPEEFYKQKVLMTVVDGDVVYKDESF